MIIKHTLTDSSEMAQGVEDERLPMLTAAVAIFGLSLLCWMPLLLPVIAVFRH